MSALRLAMLTITSLAEAEPKEIRRDFFTSMEKAKKAAATHYELYYALAGERVDLDWRGTSDEQVSGKLIGAVGYRVTKVKVQT